MDTAATAAAFLVMAPVCTACSSHRANFVDHRSKPSEILLSRNHLTSGFTAIDHQTIGNGLFIVLSNEDDIREDLYQVIRVHPIVSGWARRANSTGMIPSEFRIRQSGFPEIP